MSVKIGVKIIANANPLITKWEHGSFYNYIVVGEQISEHNGNGLCRLTIYDRNEKATFIEKNNWKIDSVVVSPFNWSGSHIRPIITDPTGISREIFKGGYSATIFQGLSYAKDISALFTVLDDYCEFSNWFEVDFVKMKLEKDEKIKGLEERINSLENQISTLLER